MQLCKPGGSHLIADQLILTREKMSLAPRSSLRSLVLVMLHRKPRLSSSFSSSSYSAAGATATPVAPAIQPPAAPAPPDCSSHKSPDHQELVPQPLPGGPCGADDKPWLYAGSEDPIIPIPGDGSCSTVEPASGHVLPDARVKDPGGPRHGVVDPPPPPPPSISLSPTLPPYGVTNPIPGDGSCRSLEPASGHVLPDTRAKSTEDPAHGFLDPPPPPPPSISLSPPLPPYGVTNPIHGPPPPPPETGSSTPGPDKPLSSKPNNSEIVLDLLPDPPRR